MYVIGVICIVVGILMLLSADYGSTAPHYIIAIMLGFGGVGFLIVGGNISNTSLTAAEPYTITVSDTKIIDLDDITEDTKMNNFELRNGILIKHVDNDYILATSVAVTYKETSRYKRIIEIKEVE